MGWQYLKCRTDGFTRWNEKKKEEASTIETSSCELILSVNLIDKLQFRKVRLDSLNGFRMELFIPDVFKPAG